MKKIKGYLKNTDWAWIYTISFIAIVFLTILVFWGMSL